MKSFTLEFAFHTAEIAGHQRANVGVKPLPWHTLLVQQQLAEVASNIKISQICNRLQKKLATRTSASHNHNTYE